MIWRFSQLKGREEYKEREKTQSENGQMKLLLSEILLLWYIGVFDPRNRNKKISIVYVGSAPGNHIPVLVEIVRAVVDCSFVLYDSVKHCWKLEKMARDKTNKITIINKVFVPETDVVLNMKTDNTVTVLISDIRTDYEGTSPPSEVIRADQEFQNRVIEESIKNNVFNIVSTKTRPDFPRSNYGFMKFPRLDGDRLFLQAKTNKQSTEMRQFLAMLAKNLGSRNTEDMFAPDDKDPGKWVLGDHVVFSDPAASEPDEPVGGGPKPNNPKSQAAWPRVDTGKFWELVDFDRAKDIESAMAYYNQTGVRDDNQPKLIDFILSKIPEECVWNIVDFARLLNEELCNKNKMLKILVGKPKTELTMKSKMLEHAAPNKMIFDERLKTENISGTPLLYLVLKVITKACRSIQKDHPRCNKKAWSVKPYKN